jgi:tripartite-type tricarboxylate transporter receptor subunit TctC
MGMGAAARAPADGYTILAAGGNFVINPSLYAKIPYDPVADFAAVTMLCSSPHVLAVHPSVPAASLHELVALAKAGPGKLSYASAGRGTPAHLAGELFRLAFAVDLTHVPFSGGGQAITSTIGGHTSMAVSAVPTAVPYVQGGNVRALAVMSASRASALPDVPTMAELGRPLEADIVTGLLVRAGTPQEIIDLLHREVVKVMAMPEVRDRLVTLGFEPVASAPDAFAAWIREEAAKWGKVIRDANIAVQ